MFFVFHILVILIHLSAISSHSVGDGYLHVRHKENKQNTSFEDAVMNKTSIFTTHIPIVQIIQNLTKVKRNNLKSNVFDRMLAGEMFSIKQRFHDKDMTFSSPPQTTKTNAQKPTLEIRQKWPIITFLEKENIDKLNDFEGRPENEIKSNISVPKHNKVVGVRSLSGSLRHMQDIIDAHSNSIAYPDLIPHSEPAKKCHFSKTTVCSRHTPSQQTCLHSQKQAQSSIAYAYYPVYLPYGAPTQNPFINADYQDTSLDWKYPKHEYLYYEDSTAGDADEDKQYRDYDYDTTRKSHKSKHKPRKQKVVIKVQYSQKTDEPPTKLPSDVHDFHHNKFDDNLANDLNSLYRESFVKKCYCSSSLQTSVTGSVPCLIALKFIYYFIFTE